jgi:hypothetical protein
MLATKYLHEQQQMMAATSNSRTNQNEDEHEAHTGTKSPTIDAEGVAESRHPKCTNKALRKGMTSGDANNIRRSTQKGLSSPIWPMNP